MKIKRNIEFWCELWLNARDVKEKFLKLRRNGITLCFMLRNLTVKSVRNHLWHIFIKAKIEEGKGKTKYRDLQF